VNDRYIIIDQEKQHHFGTSIKDLGKKMFSKNKLEEYCVEIILQKLK
jgi:hypothetical protein